MTKKVNQNPPHTHTPIKTNIDYKFRIRRPTQITSSQKNGELFFYYDVVRLHQLQKLSPGELDM